MALAADDVVTPFLSAKPGPGQPRPETRMKNKTVKDPTAAIRSKRYRDGKKQQDRDAAGKAQALNRDDVPAEAPVGAEIVQTEKPIGVKEIVTAVPVQEAPPIVPAQTSVKRHGHGVDAVAYCAAIALAGSAAWFSIRGMVVLFPGSPNSVVAFAVSMEVAKLVTAGWLAKQWRTTAWVWRLALTAFVFGLAVINAAGVFSQLVAAHVGERGAAQSAVETQAAALAAKIEVAAGKVADLDRQIGQIDMAIETAAAKGKVSTALSAIEGQRKARGGLAGEREKAAGTLAALKGERAQVAAHGHLIETEAAPILYVAELLGIGTDSEKAIRWLIALMVLCCDPLAIALTAAASAQRGSAAR